MSEKAFPFFPTPRFPFAIFAAFVVAAAMGLAGCQTQNVCVPISDQVDSGAPDANAAALPVCQANPDIDAAFPSAPEAGTPALDAGGDAGTAAGPSDAAFDATLDAGPDATLTDSSA